MDNYFQIDTVDNILATKEQIDTSWYIIYDVKGDDNNG